MVITRSWPRGSSLSRAYIRPSSLGLTRPARNGHRGAVTYAKQAILMAAATYAAAGLFPALVATAPVISTQLTGVGRHDVMPAGNSCVHRAISGGRLIITEPFGPANHRTDWGSREAPSYADLSVSAVTTEV